MRQKSVFGLYEKNLWTCLSNLWTVVTFTHFVNQSSFANFFIERLNISFITRKIKMAVVNKRFLVCMLLNYLRNRRKKMEMTKRITTILVHLEARRNILISKCLLQIEILLLNEKLNVLKRNQRKPRSCRRFVRNSGWWELVRDTYDANRFFETFRMSRETFNYISEQVQCWIS